MECFLCPAVRKDAQSLADHFVFWHNAPRAEAVTTAWRIAGSEPPEPIAERPSWRSDWIQMRLPLTDRT